MPYTYDARYNTILHVDDAEDGAFDERGLLKDGKKVRVPMTMQDAATVDDARRRSLDDSALYDLDVSNMWRGGIAALQAGDIVTINDTQCVVKSYEDDKLVLTDANPGCVTLRDASPTLSDARRDAYLAYDAEIQNAWRRY